MLEENRKQIKEQIKKEERQKYKEKVQHPLFISKRTFGQKSADAFTKWVGSWAFIILTMLLVAAWISINTTWLIFGRTWDPFPFILLNLALSTLAAIQAPIILMSQNRQTERDRIRAEYDYSVNRKAEREIREMKDLILKLHKRKSKN